MVKSDGKWFEEKTANELTKVYAGTEVKVYPSKHLQTSFGDTQQVDAYLKGHPAYDFIIFECKDEGKIGKKASRQAEGIMKDVGANHAAIVGNGPFTRPLIKRCKHYGIDLLHIVDSEEKRLRTTVEFEIISSFTWIQEYRYRGLFCGKSFDIKIPPAEIRSEYSEETIHKMVCNLWNEGVLNKSPGLHKYTRDKFEMLTSPEHGLLHQVVDGLRFEYKVVKKYFLHRSPLAEGSGVLDVFNSQFTLTSPMISVGPMKIEDFAINENQINAEEAKKKSAQVAFVGEASYLMV